MLHMPRRKVKFQKGSIYHLFNRGVDRQPIFHTPDDYDLLTRLVKQKLLPCATVLTYAWMPNHFHLMVQLKHDDLSSAMQKLLRAYVSAFNSQHGREGPLFQGRFRAKPVTDDHYMLWLSRYHHLNALEAHLVESARDWPYSSYPVYLEPHVSSIASPGLILDRIGGRTVYEAFVETSMREMPGIFQTELDAFINGDEPSERFAGELQTSV
jgi:putative transposase